VGFKPFKVINKHSKDLIKRDQIVAPGQKSFCFSNSAKKSQKNLIRLNFGVEVKGRI
jgi:hypothetical protein